MRVDYHRWRRWAGPALAGVGRRCWSLVLVPGVGVGVNGATRWLGSGPFSIQPSEFAKLGRAAVRRRPARPGAPTACTDERQPDPAAGARRHRRWWPCWSCCSPNLGTTIVLGRHRARVLFVGRRAAGPLGRLAPSADGRGRRLAGAQRRVPPGPVLRLPRPVGRPAATPATRPIQALVRPRRRAACPASASAPAGPSGASCPLPTPTSSSPSSARSSAWSARVGRRCCSSRPRRVRHPRRLQAPDRFGMLLAGGHHRVVPGPGRS